MHRRLQHVLPRALAFGPVQDVYYRRSSGGTTVGRGGEGELSVGFHSTKPHPPLHKSMAGPDSPAPTPTPSL